MFKIKPLRLEKERKRITFYWLIILMKENRSRLNIRSKREYLKMNCDIKVMIVMNFFSQAFAKFYSRCFSPSTSFRVNTLRSN